MLKRDRPIVKKAADRIFTNENEKKGKNLRTFLIETYDNLRQPW